MPNPFEDYCIRQTWKMLHLAKEKKEFLLHLGY